MIGPFGLNKNKKLLWTLYSSKEDRQYANNHMRAEYLLGAYKHITQGSVELGDDVVIEDPSEEDILNICSET